MPIVVAINKIDKDDINVDLVLNGLLEHEIVPEEYGGDVPVCRVSAMTGAGVRQRCWQKATGPVSAVLPPIFATKGPSE